MAVYFGRASSVPFPDRDFPARGHVPRRTANEQDPARDSGMKKEIPIER